MTAPFESTRFAWGFSPARNARPKSCRRTHKTHQEKELTTYILDMGKFALAVEVGGKEAGTGDH